MPSIFDLAPTPKSLSILGGEFNTGSRKFIQLQANDVRELLPAVKQTKLGWEVTASPKAPKEKVGLTIRLDKSADIKPQGYKLDVGADGIEIVAADAAGAFYGACTLAQLRKLVGKKIPCLSITDWPDFPVRGVMMDISRDKVPTMETLFRLIDLFASWKINHFQLYTEHTFAYLAHPTVWKKASPMTGEEILALDEYCKERFIELVPNQNTFGHMTRWLEHEEYNSMAEQPEGGMTKWGVLPPFSLDPNDERTIPFIRGLFEELLPHFSSEWFNVGLDETVDLGCGKSKEICEKLGKDRVYFDYLLKIHSLVKEHGKKMMFWGDIIMEHPELIPELPEEIIALEWGYEFDHPFEEHGKKFAAAGIPFFVCPGTMTWNTLCGKTENTIGNVENATRNGLANGSTGVLMTDWGDNGHWQPIPVSYLGFLAGAMASWNTAADLRERLPEKLSVHAFGDPTGKTGKTFFDLGNIYRVFAKRVENQTTQWRVIFRKLDSADAIEGVEVSEFDSLDRELEKIVSSAQGMQPEDPTVAEEYDYIVQMLDIAADAGRMRLGGDRPKDLDERIARMKKSHERVWLQRNRAGGLTDSLRKYTI